MQFRRLSSCAWVVRKCGTPRDVLNPQVISVEDESCRKLFNPNVTVKINAVSLNPIDHWLVNGRGENISKTYKMLKPGVKKSDLLIPGRDFHGTVMTPFFIGQFHIFRRFKILYILPPPYKRMGQSNFLAISLKKGYVFTDFFLQNCTCDQKLARPILRGEGV